MAVNAFTEISPPARRKSNLDIFTVLEQVVDGDVMRGDGPWIGGIQFVPEPCGGGGISLNECATEECQSKVANTLEESVKWRPWNVYSMVRCSTFSTPGEVPAAARQTFDNSKGVISAFELTYGAANYLQYSGVGDDVRNPILATPNQIFPTSATGDWIDAEVKMLDEGWRIILNTLADLYTGTEGVIHVSPGLASLLLTVEAIDVQGGVIRTNVGGHLVLAANGYPGGAPRPADELPNGQSPAKYHPGVEWVYVTGPVGLALGDVHEDTTLEHRRNNYYTLAEQFVLPYFDPSCAQFAVPVTVDEDALTTDFTDEFQGEWITRIQNDQIVACIDPDGGTEGQEISPGLSLGLTFPG